MLGSQTAGGTVPPFEPVVLAAENSVLEITIKVLDGAETTLQVGQVVSSTAIVVVALSPVVIGDEALATVALARLRTAAAELGYTLEFSAVRGGYVFLRKGVEVVGTAAVMAAQKTLGVFTKIGEAGQRVAGRVGDVAGRAFNAARSLVTRAAPNTMRGAPTNLGPVGSKAPNQVTPGIRELEGHYINHRGISQPWRAHYDEFGRLIGRTDYNAGNRAAGIPDIHHHTYRWGPGMTPMETGSHLLGEFTP